MSCSQHRKHNGFYGNFHRSPLPYKHAPIQHKAKFARHQPLQVSITLEGVNAEQTYQLIHLASKRSTMPPSLKNTHCAIRPNDMRNSPIIPIRVCGSHQITWTKIIARW